MAGASKNRQKRERKNGDGNGNGNSEKKSSTTSSGSDSSPKSDQPSPARYDGNRDPSQQATGGAAVPTTGVAPPINRNVDFGFLASAYAAGFKPSALPLRPKILNKSGKDVIIKLNVFAVKQYPQKPVYQYDIFVGNGAEKRALIKKCWNSKAVTSGLGPGWIFDGNKIAWSLNSIEAKTIRINLDEEEGKAPRKNKQGEATPDIKTVQIRPARVDSPTSNDRFKKVDFDSLRQFLTARGEVNNSTLEAINFLDHLMRETPSRKLIPIKRSFFSRGQNRANLGGGIEAFRGAYASIRPVLSGPEQKGLAVNVDVMNTAFWVENKLVNTAQELLGARDPNQLAQMLRPGEDGAIPARMSGILRRLKRVQFSVQHQPGKVFTITGFLNKNATQHKFTDKEGKQRTIQAYFQERYNIRLAHPFLPLVKTQKEAVVFPMEVCQIAPAQRYNFKLSDTQTTNMLNFAVTEPDRRWQSIEESLRTLDWGNDIYMKQYGLSISDQATTVKAKVLPPPKVAFRQGSRDSPANPGTSGRWDLKGDKKFLRSNLEPLRHWGVCVIPGRGEASREGTQAFVKTFVDVYKRHGGQVQNPTPFLVRGDQDPAKAVETAWTQTGNNFKSRPQLLVFIVPDKDSQRYVRIKKSCDCRYGVPSQVLQAQQVMKNNFQYCSNVAMKVNAKLGGVTAQAIGMKGNNSWFPKPTMIIGADVTHGAPVAAGGTHNAQTEATSIAAMAVSWDRSALKYVASCETNGSRVEIIATDTIQKILRPLVDRWAKVISGGVLPHHVFYIRDGVSEGQYMQVLEQEVADMKEMFRAIDAKHQVKFTVLVATKRHHIRFFPQSGGGDRKGNALPGTLVETGCTHPFEYDFYLCSHAAIKGTARPVHYHVIKDEAELGVEELQNMIYESSYQYVRSTTPVSMFPAVYYAHLAAARATAHIDVPALSSGPEEQTQATTSDVEIKPLLPLKEDGGLPGTMWFV